MFLAADLGIVYETGKQFLYFSGTSRNSKAYCHSHGKSVFYGDFVFQFRPNSFRLFFGVSFSLGFRIHCLSLPFFREFDSSSSVSAEKPSRGKLCYYFIVLSGERKLVFFYQLLDVLSRFLL